MIYRLVLGLLDGLGEGVAKEGVLFGQLLQLRLHQPQGALNLLPEDVAHLCSSSNARRPRRSLVDLLLHHGLHLHHLGAEDRVQLLSERSFKTTRPR